MREVATQSFVSDLKVESLSQGRQWTSIVFIGKHVTRLAPTPRVYDYGYQKIVGD